jgi:hypothetical protein
MTATFQRQLVFEVERVQTVRRCVPTIAAYCEECLCEFDFVELSEFARTFEVSVAEAVLQMRERGVHMQHLKNGNIVICTGSLLTRSDPEQQILIKSLPPGSGLHLTDSSD